MDFLSAAATINVWLLAIFVQNITNDNKARTSCRKKLLDLKNELKELALQLRIPQRRYTADINKIKKIQSIIRKIEVDHADFFLKIPGLRQLIDESEKIIGKAINDSNNPSFIAVDLLGLWGIGFGKNYDAKKINELRRFVDSYLTKRIYRRLIILIIR